MPMPYFTPAADGGNLTLTRLAVASGAANPDTTVVDDHQTTLQVGAST